MVRSPRRAVAVFLFLVASIAVPTPSSANEEPLRSTIHLWEWDVDRIAPQLPHWETPEERAALANQPPPPILVDPPPLAPIRNVGEHEPMTMALIRYPLGVPYALIREMAEDVQISCIVSQGNYNTARTNFQNNGVDPNSVDWIIAPSDSYWARDYGPWFVFDGDGDIAIIDHFYNRPARPNDNAIPIVCGQHWGIPVHTHNLWHAGGNYMTDGYGISFSTDLVWDENAGMTHAQVFDLMQDYYGLQTYNVLTDDFISYIRHIDCWAKILDEETILVKEVAASHPDRWRLEQNATIIASLQGAMGRNYRVVRVYCQSIGGNDVAAYTNSLILNRKVLVPTFNNQTYDQAALQAYRNAMPGYEVLGVAYGGWLTDDALHCRVMGVADPQMLRVAHVPIVEWTVYAAVPIRAMVDDRSETGLAPGQPLLYWRAYPTGSPPPPFASTTLSPDPAPDWYEGEIPAQAEATRVDYFIHAEDLSGRTEGLPRTEPDAWYSFEVDLPVAGADHLALEPLEIAAAAYPNPLRDRTRFSFRLLLPARVELSVVDASGRKVRALCAGERPAGDNRIDWDGADDLGKRVPAGIYFFDFRAGDVRHTRKVAVLP